LPPFLLPANNCWTCFSLDTGLKRKAFRHYGDNDRDLLHPTLSIGPTTPPVAARTYLLPPAALLI
jgi:hypothetical protein